MRSEKYSLFSFHLLVLILFFFASPVFPLISGLLMVVVFLFRRANPIVSTCSRFPLTVALSCAHLPFLPRALSLPTHLSSCSVYIYIYMCVCVVFVLCFAVVLVCSSSQLPFCLFLVEAPPCYGQYTFEKGLTAVGATR